MNALYPLHLSDCQISVSENSYKNDKVRIYVPKLHYKSNLISKFIIFQKKLFFRVEIAIGRKWAVAAQLILADFDSLSTLLSVRKLFYRYKDDYRSTVMGN